MADEIDLQTAFATAAALLGKSSYNANVKFYPYAGLKSTIRLRDGQILAKVSDGYSAADLDCLTGLALDLMIKLFRISKIDARMDSYLEKFQSLNGRGVYELHESLRGRRGRKRMGKSEGSARNLQWILDKVLGDCPEAFAGIGKPSIIWSRDISHRRLAFYDTAFGQIVVSRKFDSDKYPEFFLEYLVYHELLHAKHDVKYGKRRRVHHREFVLDEKKFPRYEEARALMGKI
ncbi:MAG: hypothetical protein ABH863_05845 [Candidatus Micrarchaeota archaeon]